MIHSSHITVKRASPDNDVDPCCRFKDFKEYDENAGIYLLRPHRMDLSMYILRKSLWENVYQTMDLIQVVDFGQKIFNIFPDINDKNQ